MSNFMRFGGGPVLSFGGGGPNYLSTALIVRFVTHLVKTYTLYIFIAAVWGGLGLPSFFDRNFFW